MKNYNPHLIERKWQKFWDKSNIYQTDLNQTENKFYCLDMFPYPSGEGLHVGHWRGYVLSDFYARYWRLKGKNVFHPMGFDAFGLPAENAAIKKNSHPAVFTSEAIKKFTSQLKDIGASYDWSKTIDTSKEDYYKWTQWLFLQLYKNKMAYKKKAWVNWCPKDQTVLANEQVINGCCERCSNKVEKRSLEQWFFKITDFAQELLEGLDDLEWPENVKTLQRNWIGRSEGAMVKFLIQGADNEYIEVFTTRADTLFGVNALVLAPEHPLVDKIVSPKNRNIVEKFIKEISSRTNIDRLQGVLSKKSAVDTGAFAVHPLTTSNVPIWIADYVLMDYATGAVMSVPAHDKRDYEFAKTYNLPIVEVIKGNGQLPYEGEGVLINSSEFNGLTSVDAARQIIKALEKRNLGRSETLYHLRDWLISRQRYWGAPIPIIYCHKCCQNQSIINENDTIIEKGGKEYLAVMVKEEELPVRLPEDVEFLPGGEPPLERSASFKEVACPRCGAKYPDAFRDSDTLDTFVDSSWYYLRYLSHNDKKKAFDKERVKHWLPVDLYIGGIEHAVLHLLYARFISRFLAKFGYLDKKNAEPFRQLFNIGMINLHGTKMSKSKGNIVNADELVAQYGCDTVRGYELFLGPMDTEVEWSGRGINGIHRFLIKLYQLPDRASEKEYQEQREHFATYLSKIEKIIESWRLNTVISEAMTLVNKLEKYEEIDKKVLTDLVITLSPVFPHISEEVFQLLGGHDSIFKQSWPFSQQRSSGVTIKILINQKYAGELVYHKSPDQEVVLQDARENVKIAAKFKGKPIKKYFYQKDKVLNIIV